MSATAHVLLAGSLSAVSLSQPSHLLSYAALADRRSGIDGWRQGQQYAGIGVPHIAHAGETAP